MPLEDFGIHGSIALGMHTVESDIDLVVYGSRNFRSLERAIDSLVDEGALSLVVTKRLDRLRKHRGRYRGKVFVYNAVRRFEEITSRYGEYRYFPVKPVTFSGQIVDDKEAMFRPAIYQIANYQPLDSTSTLGKSEIPTKVVSMMGMYRNVARCGDAVRVSGTLERVAGLTMATYIIKWWLVLEPARMNIFGPSKNAYSIANCSALYIKPDLYKA